MGFKEHVAIKKALTRAVRDHLKRSGHISNMSSSSILERKKDMFKTEELGRSSKYFVGFQH